MSSEDDATASQGGEDEFKDAAAQAEGEEKEEGKIPNPLGVLAVRRIPFRGSPHNRPSNYLIGYLID